MNINPQYPVWHLEVAGDLVDCRRRLPVFFNPATKDLTMMAVAKRFQISSSRNLDIIGHTRAQPHLWLPSSSGCPSIATKICFHHLFVWADAGCPFSVPFHHGPLISAFNLYWGERFCSRSPQLVPFPSGQGNNFQCKSATGYSNR